MDCRDKDTIIHEADASNANKGADIPGRVEADVGEVFPISTRADSQSSGGEGSHRDAKALAVEMNTHQEKTVLKIEEDEIHQVRKCQVNEPVAPPCGRDESDTSCRLVAVDIDPMTTRWGNSGEEEHDSTTDIILGEVGEHALDIKWEILDIKGTWLNGCIGLRHSWNKVLGAVQSPGLDRCPKHKEG